MQGALLQCVRRLWQKGRTSGLRMAGEEGAKPVLEWRKESHHSLSGGKVVFHTFFGGSYQPDQENVIFTSPFCKYFQFGLSTGLGRESTTCLITNSKSEDAVSGYIFVSFCQFCSPWTQITFWKCLLASVLLRLLHRLQSLMWGVALCQDACGHSGQVLVPPLVLVLHSLAHHLLLKPTVLHVVILRFIIQRGGEREQEKEVTYLKAKILRKPCIRKPVNAKLSVVLFVFFYEPCSSVTLKVLVSHPLFYYSWSTTINILDWSSEDKAYQIRPQWINSKASYSCDASVLRLGITF